MENQQKYEYEEISIKELIETIISGKKIIIGVTIIALTLAFIFSFYILTPIYEAKTTLLASNITEKVSSVNVENIEDYINTLSNQGLSTLETYRQQIKSPEVLTQVIEDLELDREKHSIEGLQNNITVKIIEDTNLIEISVRSGSPKLSKEIANGVSNAFITFVNQLNEKKVNQSAQFLETKITQQEMKLQNAMEKYEQFLAENENVQTVQNEISILLTDEKSYKSKLEKLESYYKEDLLKNELNITRTSKKLEKVKSVLKTVDKKLKTNTNVLGNDLLRESLMASGVSVGSLTSVNLTEETYNQNYLSLESHINQLEIKLDGYKQNIDILKTEYNKKKELYSTTLDNLENKLEVLQMKLTELKHEKDLLTNEIENAKKTYELLVNKYDEIKITESVKAGELNLVINSTAYVPDQPISPNKKLNLAIALVLGLMIGVFIVFFKSMWNSEE